MPDDIANALAPLIRGRIDATGAEGASLRQIEAWVSQDSPSKLHPAGVMAATTAVLDILSPELAHWDVYSEDPAFAGPRFAMRRHLDTPDR